ncbi:MAG: TatD family hydrolase [Candidatus Paceibacterota bacterium]|jgi:TatD DNase family protein
MLIDTHAHLNFNAFKDDHNQVIDQCFKNDIQLINVGSQYETSKRAVEIAERYKTGVWAAIGLHPIHAIPNQVDVNEVEPSFKSRPEEFDAKKYEILAKSKKVVAIGEIGLDYTYAKTEEDKEAQKKSFKQQVLFAQKLNLPIIIHCREAWKDLVKILKFEIRNSKFEIPLRGTAHFFSGTKEDAREMIELGFLISFTGVITFTKAYDEIIKETPLEKLMVETDCPYVAPVPFRGKKNLPLYVKYVAERIAEIKGIGFQEVAQVTTQNAKTLFKLN